MQIAIVARDGGNELADKVYRAVVSSELTRMQARHARQIDDLTEAHRMTEARLSGMYKRELARMDKPIRRSLRQRITQRISTGWAMLWGMALELGLVVEGRDGE